MKSSKLTSLTALSAPLLLTAAAGAEYTGVVATVMEPSAELFGYGPAHVIRLYAAFDAPDDRLVAVFGDTPMEIDLQVSPSGEGVRVRYIASRHVPVPSPGNRGLGPLRCARHDAAAESLDRQ